MGNPFIRAREGAEASGSDNQGLNRDWWESLPMTYAEWDGEDRAARTLDDFMAIEKYTFATGPFFRNEYNFAAQSSRKVLDIGSGSGVFSCCFAKAGAKVTAVDLTQAGVQMTVENSHLQKLQLEVIRGDAENLPFQENVFDYVFSWGVLHHTSAMETALSEAARVLKPEGRGLIMVYHRQSVVYYLHGLYWLLFKRKLFCGYTFESVQNFYTDGYYHRYLTRYELRKALADVGLETSRILVTQYEKKILPGIPKFLDVRLKALFGMCIVAEFRKST